MTDYAKAARSAAAKIQKAGQPATLRRSVAGVYDTDTSTVGAPVVTNDPCYVVLFDYNLQSGGVGEIDGNLVQVGDKKILLPALGLTLIPAPGDFLIVGAVTWTVKNVKALNPAGTPILYELNGRR